MSIVLGREPAIPPVTQSPEAIDLSNQLLAHQRKSAALHQEARQLAIASVG